MTGERSIDSGVESMWGIDSFGQPRLVCIAIDYGIVVGSLDDCGMDEV